MLEEEFGRGMQKLAKNTADLYAMNDGKAGCVRPLLSRSFFVPTRVIFPQLFRHRVADEFENTRDHC